MSREAFHNLLKRYLEGNCNAAEKRIVEQWYSMLDDEELQEIKGAELSAIDDKIWNSINSRTNISGEEQTPEEAPTRSLWVKLAVAASLIGILATAAYVLNTDKSNSSRFLKELSSSAVVKLNETASPLVIALEDGSIITLQPNAQITYPANFEKARREVFVHGEAFFQVSKDRSRPFYVYSHDLITEVVGTSFTVKTGDEVHESVVEVRTGKVLVSKNENDDVFYKKLLPAAEKITLTPNLKVVYQPQTKDLVVKLVAHPLPVASENSTQEKTDFVFNDTPISEVLAQLEKAYGIEITTNNKRINKCPFTGDVKDQDLYTRLDFICQAVGATYKIDGTKILILGGQCN